MTRPTWTNLSYLGAGELLTRGLGFLAFAYLGRVLLPVQFGTLGSALAVIMVCTLLIDFGFGILGSRDISRRPDVAAGLVPRVVSTQVTMALAVAGAVVAATAVLPLDLELAALLRGLAISLLGVPFLLNWVFQGRNEMFWYAAPTVLRWLVFLAGVLAIVRAPEHLVRLPAAEIAAVLAAAAGFLWACRRAGLRLSVRPGWDAALLRSVAPVGASNLIWAVRMYLPVMVVYGVAGSGAAGLFEAAHRIVMVFVALLGTYFINVFPAISASAVLPGPALGGWLRRTLLVSLAATLALTAVMAGLSPMALTLVFGDAYVEPASVAALVVLTAMTPVLAARRTARFALIALDRQRLELWCSVAGVALLVVLLAGLTRTAGVTGAAWAMWLSEAVAAGLSWLALAPHLRAHQNGTRVGA